MPSNDLARVASPAPQHDAAGRLTRPQKAAIIVRFLLNEGADVPLSDLPDPLQEVLTTQMGAMRYVDRKTLGSVVSEFAGELEGMGLTFPRGVAGALSELDGRISPQTAARLRKEAGVRQFGDPWEQVRNAPADHLRDLLETESTEVAAILLSKLDVPRAAELLGQLPGQTARRITYAVSRTSAATPESVDRIGLSLAAQLHAVPAQAFDDGPVERVGAILNCSQRAIREELLTGLEETDEDFAQLVRRAIFTFANIPERLEPSDVPAIARELAREDLVTALAGARGAGEETAAAAEFLLGNLSKRMRDALRDEVEERGPVDEPEGEAAMARVVTTIRQLEGDGRIALRVATANDSAR
ncbi:flagellar motor switch protein FliG [Roseovarius salis]|uniref:flagellar motor switch protein FliG n=1 Tax=Roseovarius salis TaxID=3376063 RepID=UPI0037C518E8